MFSVNQKSEGKRELVKLKQTSCFSRLLRCSSLCPGSLWLPLGRLVGLASLGCCARHPLAASWPRDSRRSCTRLTLTTASRPGGGSPLGRRCLLLFRLGVRRDERLCPLLQVLALEEGRHLLGSRRAHRGADATQHGGQHLVAMAADPLLATALEGRAPDLLDAGDRARRTAFVSRGKDQSARGWEKIQR